MWISDRRIHRQCYKYSRLRHCTAKNQTRNACKKSDSQFFLRNTLFHHLFHQNLPNMDCKTKSKRMHHPQDSVMVERRWLREKPRDLQFIPARKKQHLQNPSKSFKTMEKGMLSRCRPWCNVHARIEQHSNRAMVACVEILIWSQKSLQQKPCCRLPMERRLQERQETQIIISCIS
jgi:hypothetical protein